MGLQTISLPSTALLNSEVGLPCICRMVSEIQEYSLDLLLRSDCWMLYSALFEQL